jgi:FkbM family methyltransferase
MVIVKPASVKPASVKPGSVNRHAATAKFGLYPPRLATRALIGFAQRRRNRGLDRILALIARKLAILLQPGPYDVEIQGLKLRLYPRDNVGERKFLFMPGWFDPAERALIERELPPDGVFVDIGANVGLYTLWAGRKLGAGGRLLAFEPQAEALRRLKANLSFNYIEAPVTLIEAAAWDADATLAFQDDRDNLGGGSAVLDHGETPGHVPARAVAAVLAESGIGRIDILKIDIEGAEDRVLAGLLAQAPPALHPRWMIVENGGGRWLIDLPGLLAANGYAPVAEHRMNTIWRRIA